MVGELAAGGAQAVLIDIAAEMGRSLSRYKMQIDEAVSYWDYLHTEYKCCGVDGPTDWTSRDGDMWVPYSCCADKLATDRCNATVGAYTDGCLPVMVLIMGDYVASIGIAVVFAVMTLLLTMAATLALIWS